MTEMTSLYVIHSHTDELFPASTVEQAVSRLQAKGKSAQLVLLDDLGHFDIGAFFASLKAAILWITQVWDQNKS